MPACAKKARVRLTLVSASTKPIGVVAVAVLGVRDTVQLGFPAVVPLVIVVQLAPNGVQTPLTHTEIGLITTKPFTGVGVVTWACAVPRTRNAAAENNIACAINPQRSLKFMVC